jgi:hypothetical protein
VSPVRYELCVSQKTAFFIVTAVKASSLSPTLVYMENLWTWCSQYEEICNVAFGPQLEADRLNTQVTNYCRQPVYGVDKKWPDVGLRVVFVSTHSRLLSRIFIAILIQLLPKCRPHCNVKYFCM